MLTPSQEFHKARKDFERLHNEHATRLTQQHNAMQAETKQLLSKLDEIVEFKVEQRLKFHLETIGMALRNVEQKLRDHFGPT